MQISIKSTGYVDYLFAVSPLVFGHLIVPPLSHFYGERLGDSFLKMVLDFVYDNFTPSSLFRKENVLSLALDKKRDNSLEHILPWITHIFVHGDYQHMMLNLQALLAIGCPVYSTLGLIPFYSVFLLGGAMSEFPSFLHTMQQGKVSGTSILPRFFRQSLQTLIRLFQRDIHCGSSGGVFALLGSGTALQVLNISRLFYQCHRDVQYQLSRRETLRFSYRSHNNSSRSSLSSSSSVSVIGLYFQQMAKQLFTRGGLITCFELFNQYVTISREVDYLTSEDSSTSINYAAHVQGFLFGLASTVSILLFRSLKRN